MITAGASVVMAQRPSVLQPSHTIFLELENLRTQGIRNKNFSGDVLIRSVPGSFCDTSVLLDLCGGQMLRDYMTPEKNMDTLKGF